MSGVVDVKLQDWGNSYGLRIPKTLAKKVGLVKGDTLTVLLERKSYDIDDAFGMWKGAPSFKRDRDDRF